MYIIDRGNRLACLLCPLVALMLAGCVGASAVRLSDEGRKQVSSAYVDADIELPAEFIFKSRAETMVQGLAVAGVLAPGFAAVRIGSPDDIHALARSQQGEMKKIFAEEFASAVKAAGKFRLTDQPAEANARFRFKVEIYGLGLKTGFSGKQYVNLAVSASLVSGNGQILWQQYDFVIPANSAIQVGATPEEYLADPELFRSAFRNTSAVLAQMLVKHM